MLVDVNLAGASSIGALEGIVKIAESFYQMNESSNIFCENFRNTPFSFHALSMGYMLLTKPYGMLRSK